jgi:hypothetical protein
LDQVSLPIFIKKLESLGLVENTIAILEGISSNAREIIEKNLTKLNDPELTLEEFNIIKTNIDTFMKTIASDLNSKSEIVSNKDYIEIEKEIFSINKDYVSKVEEAKPELLKIHNYAFELLLKQLKSGNSDKEVFLEAEKMMKEEIVKITSNIFPDSKNLSFESLLAIMKEIPAVLSIIEASNLESEEADPDAYSYDTSLETLITQEEINRKANPLYKGFFNNDEIFKFVINTFDKDTTLLTISEVLKNAITTFNFNKESIDRVNDFIELSTKGLNLKANTIYDFIRKFELSLDSNPESVISKIFDILEREEVNLKSSSNVANFMADNIREQDINQAINYLRMMQSVVNAMSTTQTSYGDPYGMIQSRINYAKKYDTSNDVTKLKTITSDVASLIDQDLELIVTKLTFMKELAGYNSGRMLNEQELIRTKVDDILLSN